jgi:2-haloacid dehalogenase
MNKVETVIFDLGNVLIDWNPRYLYRKIFDTEEKVEWFLTEVCDMEWNEAQDGGRSFAEGNREVIQKFPEYEKEIKLYFERWQEMLGGADEEVVEILKTLRDNPAYRIYALTNWSAETFPIAIKQFEFLKWFEGVLVSGKVHLKKPDPAIYDLLLKRYQIIPSQAIFIDDSQRNVDAANKFGLPSIRFESAAQLKIALKKYGVPV